MKNLDGKNRGQQNLLKSPHNIPMAIYIQEADTLYHWVLNDKEALATAGLDMELVYDLPNRCEAATKAEAYWYVQLNSKQKDVLEWEKHAPLAFDLRKQLLDFFRFAFRGYPHLMETLKYITAGYSHAKKIQDLNDLGVLGKTNSALLEAIHFDMSLLDKAAQASAELTVLLANATRDRMAPYDAKKIRDQAYTHLKKAVDEIRFFGRFVFRNNKERLIGYRSDFIRQAKMKRAKN